MTEAPYAMISMQNKQKCKNWLDSGGKSEIGKTWEGWINAHYYKKSSLLRCIFHLSNSKLGKWGQLLSWSYWPIYLFEGDAVSSVYYGLLTVRMLWTTKNKRQDSELSKPEIPSAKVFSTNHVHINYGFFTKSSFPPFRRWMREEDGAASFGNSAVLPFCTLNNVPFPPHWLRVGVQFPLATVSLILIVSFV